MQTEEILKYQDRIDQTPDDLSAYEALERLYTRAQDWHALIELYRRKAPYLSEIGEKRLLWQKIARVAEEVLDEPDLAIRSARDVLPPQALDRSTLKAIEGLCRRHRRWEDLRDFLEIAAEHTEDVSERQACIFRLGELYTAELDDVAQGLECFSELLQADPGNVDALKAVEEIFASGQGRESSAKVLEDAYRASAEWDKLFDLFERMLGTETDEDVKSSLLHRSAALVEERRGPQAAFPEFAKAFLDGGRSDAVRDDLERIAQKSGLWRDLLAVYLKSLDRTSGDETSNAILQRAASIAEENLGLKAVAEKCYRQLLSFNPGHADSLAALERIYTESGDDALLLEILEKRAEQTSDRHELLDLLRRSGEIAEHRLARAEVALQKYESVLELQPEDQEAKEALLRLYPRAGRWQALVDHLLEEASPADMLEVRRRVAEIYEDKIGEIDAAIQHQEEIRQASPGEPRALEALSRLYKRAGRHQDLLTVLEERASSEADPRVRFTLRLHIAEVYHEGLGDPQRAAELYGELLGEAVGTEAEEEARRNLERLLARGTTRAQAATLLEDFYYSNQAWQRLVDFYEKVLAYLPAGRERAQVLESIAVAYERRLDSPERAFWAHGRAIKELPSSRWSEGELLRLAADLTFYPELVGLFEDAFEALTGEKTELPEPIAEPPKDDAAAEAEPAEGAAEAASADDAAGEGSLAGEVAADEGAAPDGAAVEQAAEAAETEEEFTSGGEDSEFEATNVLDADDIIDEVLEIDEDSQVAVIDEYDAIPDAEAGPPIHLKLPLNRGQRDEAEEPASDTALRFALQLARLNEEVLERKDTAAVWYRKVRGIEPGHDEALGALDRLATERGDDEELREVLVARVDRTKKAKEEVSLRLRLGALQEGSFADVDSAIAEYRAALAAAPKSQDAFDSLESALRRSGRPEELGELYVATLDRGRDRAVSLKLSELRRQALSDAEGAIAVLEPLLEEDPRDTDALHAFEAAAVEAGYDQDERAEKLLPILQSLRDIAPTPEAWRELERRIGTILEVALGRGEEAVERYARVLREDGEDVVAREALERLARETATRATAAAVLEPFYRERQEWDALTELLRLRLEDAGDPSERAAMFGEIARVAEEFRGDKEAAFVSYSEALRAQPSEMSLLESVDRLASELGHFEELCQLLDETTEALDSAGADELERVHVLRRLAEVSLLSLEDRERALVAYRRAHELRPDDIEIFRALEELYAHLERWRDLAELFRSALERDPENRTYALRLADLLEVILESPGEALEVLRGMLDRNPGDPEALRAFEGVFTRAGLDSSERAGELVPILEALEEHAPDPWQRRGYEFRIAEIFEHSLNQPENSVERYGSVLREDPEHTKALESLERLSLLADCRPSACAILEGHYRGMHAYMPLATILDRRLEDVEGPSERADILAEVGQIQEEHLESPESAFDAYARAFAERPSDRKLLEAVRRLGTSLARFDQLASLLEEADKALSVGKAAIDHRVNLLTFLAKLYATTIESPSQAISAYERALALEPEQDDVFLALEGLYTREERYRDLANLYRGRIEREPGDRHTVLKLSRVLDEMLDAPKEALDVLRSFLDQEEQDVDAMKAFDDIFTRAGFDKGESAAELLPVLLELREAHTGEQALHYEYRAGALRELALGDRGSAVAHYADVLKAHPEHQGAREALERLLEDADTRRSVADVLEPYYRQQEEWRPLVNLLELRSSDTKSPKQRAKLLAQVGKLHEEHLDDKDAAFSAYSRAFRSSPETQKLLDAVERLASDLGQFTELATLLGEAADALEEEKREVPVGYRVGVLQRLAATCATILGENEQAIVAYSRALDLDPENDTTLTGLDRLYSAEGRARDLAGVLEKEIERAEVVPDAYDRVDLLRRLARLREEVFGDLDGAAESFEELRRISATDPEATGSLERLYEGAGRWQDLADLLLESVNDPSAGRERLLRAGELLETKVGDVDRAGEIFRRLLDADSDDIAAMRGLERVLSRPQAAGRESELLEILQALEIRSGERKDRAELLYRQGALLAGRLKDPRRAIEAFTQVLDLDASHRESLVALEELAKDDAVRDLAVERLETFYERAGAWQSLVNLYESLLEGRDSDGKRVLLRKMAEIYERELRNPRLAFEYYARLFREEPSQRELLDILERLAQEMESYEGLANLYDEFLEEIPDKTLALDLTLRLARLYEEGLGRKSLAVERYRRALEIDAECKEALDALDRIHSATEEWVELEKILRKKIELSDSNSEQAELYCRVGTLYESHLNLAGAAVDAFESALQLTPDDEAPLAALERIFAQRDDLVLRQHIAETCRSIYEARDDKRRIAALDLGIAEVTPASDRQPLLLSAAGIHEELGEADRAFRILVQGLRDGCHSEEVLTALERMAGAVSGWEELCVAADEAAQGLAEEDTEREALTLRTAKWYWDRLSNPAAAEERYAWVFRRDPAALPAFRALEAIHTAVFDADKLLDLCRRRLAVVRDREERGQLLKRIGDLNADFLQKADEAVQAYEESLRLNPEDGAVLDALAPLYEQLGRYQDLCKILERKLETADNEEKFVLRRRLAEIWGAEIGDDAQAIRQYRAALALQPQDLELWRALRWHCTRAERWQELADVLRRELELTADPGDRAAVARELAQVEEERLERPDKAADALRAVLEADPGDPEAFERYESLLEKTGRWADLAAIYEQRLVGDSSIDERAKLLASLADVAENQLNDPAKATGALEQLCELKPHDLGALRDLARIYEKQGRWKECFEFFKAHVKRVDEKGEVAVELLCRMGLLCEERAKNLDVAERCYRRALALDSASRSALQGLRRVYQSRGEPDQVAQVMEAEEQVVEGDARAVIALERGKILRDEVKDPEAAAGAFEAALAASPRNIETAQALVDLLTQGVGRERTQKSIPLLIDIFTKSRRIRDRHLTLHKLGALCESLGEMANSIAAFEGAYQASSTHLPTLLALGRLYYDAGQWDKALKMLQILLLNESSLPNQSDRVELFFRLGSIREKMGERPRAINMYQRALEIDPSHGPSRSALDELKS